MDDWLNFKLGRLKWRLGGCCLLLILSSLLACGLLVGLSFYLGRQVQAQGPDDAPHQIILLIDNSQSMYDQSDPHFWRLEAARLFITYLGVDSRGPLHQLGVVFFGTEARLAVPLTPLADEAHRREISTLMANPVGLGWTRPDRALDLATETLLEAAEPGAKQAVVLLTDGKPEWSQAPTEIEKETLIARLHDTAGLFAAENISLFIILLQNATTAADPELTEIYLPLWQEMAEMTPGGGFYRAQQSEDLLDIYHEIVVALTGRQTAGAVVQTQVQTATVETIVVEPGLAQLTLLVNKSDPALQVSIFRPDGQALEPTQPNVRYAGQAGQRVEEIWTINQPPAGEWQVRLNGQGSVTVWKDFYPATPTPTSSPTATPSSTFTPTPTLSPTATFTSMPTNTPTSTPIPLPGLTTTIPPTPYSLLPTPLLWPGVLTMFLAAAAGGWLWLRRRRPRPLLEGTLRRLAAPVQTGQTIPLHFDLDALGRREVCLGAGAKAGLRLPHAAAIATPTVWLAAQREPGGLAATVLKVVSEGAETRPVLVNELPVVSQWVLGDGDVITLGAYRFRYENLRQRRPDWLREQKFAGG